MLHFHVSDTQKQGMNCVFVWACDKSFFFDPHSFMHSKEKVKDMVTFHKIKIFNFWLQASLTQSSEMFICCCSFSWISRKTWKFAFFLAWASTKLVERYYHSTKLVEMFVLYWNATKIVKVHTMHFPRIKLCLVSSKIDRVIYL